MTPFSYKSVGSVLWINLGADHFLPPLQLSVWSKPPSSPAICRLKPLSSAAREIQFQQKSEYGSSQIKNFPVVTHVSQGTDQRLCMSISPTCLPHPDPSGPPLPISPVHSAPYPPYCTSFSSIAVTI